MAMTGSLTGDRDNLFRRKFFTAFSSFIFIMGLFVYHSIWFDVIDILLVLYVHCSKDCIKQNKQTKNNVNMQDEDTMKQDHH